jgi:alginate O-acetyltransferase complex protein AlgI
MLFNSLEFLVIFLPVVLVVFSLLKGDAARSYFLILASLFFYGWWDPRYILLLAASIAGNYATATALHQVRNQLRQRVLVVGLVWNLGLLGYFKYAGFFVDNLNHTFSFDFVVPAIVLPLAISFFTFQQIAFLVDTYRGVADRVMVSNYILFVVFFPQLVAGPIVHHSEMLPQFRRPGVFATRLGNLQTGLFIASIGLFKKVILADGVANYSDQVFALAGQQPLTFLEAWIGALAFGLQIYFDFSAYSDIAVGVALLFGIALPVNFTSPYKACNIIEFWRRWHITLSQFLRHYLYFPLGGNRAGKTRRYANLFIVMLLGGLWHGAGWNFILWGGLHGSYLAINHVWRAMMGRSNAGMGGSLTDTAFGWAITFLCVTVAWVPFRAADLATTFSLYRGMVGMNGLAWPAWLAPDTATGAELLTLALSPGALVFMTTALAIVLLLPNCYELTAKHGQSESDAAPLSRLAAFLKPPIVRIACIVLMLSTSIAFMLDEPSSFIYFQF